MVQPIHKMKLHILLIALLTGMLSFAQSDLKRISVSDLPEGIERTENISVALRWSDTLGDNILVVTKRIVMRNDDEKIEYKGSRNIFTKESRNQSRKDNFPVQIIPAFANHYQIIHDSAILTWKVAGISRFCGDEGVNHTKTWFEITDLDKNSIAEIWIYSRAECVEDEGKGIMRITMMEGYERYTISGHISETLFPESSPDNNFKNASELFKKYVMQKWQYFVLNDQ
jgi:hypothetical protein